MEEREIIELANSLPYDVFFIPQKDELPEAFVIGHQENAFDPMSANWFIFFPNASTRAYYECRALENINRRLSTI
jgi:hypothetical protein